MASEYAVSTDIPAIRTYDQLLRSTNPVLFPKMRIYFAAAPHHRMTHVNRAVDVIFWEVLWDLLWSTATLD